MELMGYLLNIMGASVLFFASSEVDDALYARGCLAVMHVDSFCLYHRGQQLEAEVAADVERRELGINVGIDDGEEVHTSEGKDAQVAETAEGILLVLEDAFEALLLAHDAIVGRMSR